MDDHEARVLALVSESEYAPLTLKAMARHFKISEDDYPGFRNAVKGLIKAGKLDIAKNKTLRKGGGPSSGTITGTFRRSSKGFGFVRPADSTDKSDQIFIPNDAGRDASTGDVVQVKIVKKAKGPGFNPEGRVLQVVTRGSGLFVGNYFEKNGAGYVKIDGTTFADPVSVGDPGAKGAKPGDKVALEMARYPSPYREGEGVITEVFGPRGQPKVETIAVIRSLGIPDVFDDDVLEEARRQAKAFDEDVVEGRDDLRDQLTLTIDPATARDFDDAITLTRDEKGYWTLGVHIADVSHFVRPGSSARRLRQEAGDQRLPARPASSRCSRRSSPTAWPASRRGTPGTPSAPSWSSTPTASGPTAGSPARPSRLTVGSPTKRSSRSSSIPRGNWRRVAIPKSAA